MAYNHLGVTEKEYFGLQHGDDSVDSLVSAVPVDSLVSAVLLRLAGLLHGLVL